MVRLSRLSRVVRFLLIVSHLVVAVAAQPDVREEGSLQWDGIPEIPSEISQSLEPYRSAFSYRFHSWNSEDGLIVSTPTSQGVFYFTIDRPGDKPTLLNEIPRRFRTSVARPGHPTEHLLITDDSSGAEIHQLHLYDSSTKKARLLSDGRSRHLGACWSPDGKTVATSSNERNGIDFDLTLVDINGVRTRLMESAGFWRPLWWSADGTSLMLSELRGAGQHRLHLYSLKDKSLTPLDSDPRPVTMASPVQRGTEVFFLSNRGSEYLSLWRWNSSTQKAKKISGKYEGDLEEFEISRKGDRVALLYNYQGYSYVYLWHAVTGVTERCLIPSGIISGLSFSPSGEDLAYTYHNGREPVSLRSYNLATKTVRAWHQGVVKKGFKRLSEFPRLVKFSGHDGLPLSAFVSQPSKTGKPFPVLIDVHGGPNAQHRPYFDINVNYLVADLGIAVISPNVRGSTGYGKTFASLDDTEQRMDAVKDIGSLLDWIEKQPELDSSRVAIVGGSYGGFVSVASLAAFPERLVAGVTIAGVSDLSASVGPAELALPLRRSEFGEDRDPFVKEQLRRISPLTRANQVRAPLFVAHGSNDPRVHLWHAEELVKAVRANGGICWYLLAKDDGHGMTKAANWKAYQDSLALFLKTYLIGCGHSEAVALQ